ncbi:MAG TPA: GntR family transcriptional regulator [Gaiellaceae bacterium]
MAQSTEERRALVDKLAAQLQARVLDGDLPPGTRLRQEALAAEFGVSRTPIREALRKLQASGLIDLRPNRGALVRGLTPREIRDAYAVRAELEGLAAEVAALRIQQTQIERLHRAQGQFRESLSRMRNGTRNGRRRLSERDIEVWGNANDEFHQVIQEAAGNEVLVATLRHLHRSFPRGLSRLVLRESTSLLAANVAEHEAVLEAIERNDSAAARTLMQQHVIRAGALVTVRFEERAITA